MGVNLAIHHRPGSFSDRWLEYCSLQNISFKIVNCLDNDIVSQLTNCQGLLWHWAYHVPADVIVARSILQVASLMGLEVFPDNNTCWFYDDKIAQKYLLQSISAPHVPTYIFYDQEKALNWVKRVSFPKVLKLSKGAGSTNVKLVGSRQEAMTLVKKAFGRGLKQSTGYFSDAKIKLQRVKQRKDYLGCIKRFPMAFLQQKRKSRNYSMERNYTYFQDFIPNNSFDTRITIIGNRAFGFTRDVRNNDFRASGSGFINYDISRIDLDCIRIAFSVARQIGSQCLGFDFIRDRFEGPQIVEMSYCFDPQAVYDCPGHWDSQLNWHSGHMWPQDGILEDLLKKLNFS